MPDRDDRPADDILNLREKAVALQVDEFTFLIAEQIDFRFSCLEQLNITADNLLHVLQRIGNKRYDRGFPRFSNYDTNFF